MVVMWTSLISALVVVAAGDFEAQTIDGQSAQGRIGQLNAQELVLETADGEARFPLAALAGLTRKSPAAPPEAKPSVWIELVDASALAAVEYSVRGGAARVVTAGGRTLEVPTRAIRHVRFGPLAGGDDKVTKQWFEITQTKAAGDLLVVRKGGVLDYLEGVLGDIDGETCHFELDKEPIPVKRPKVEGVVYFHPQAAELNEPVGQLVAADGTRLAIRTAELGEGTLTITTPAGIAVEMGIDEVSRFDFSTGKIAYLSDLEPETATHVPLLGLAEEPPAWKEFYRYRRDVGFEQNPLRLDGKVYRKGLSLASRSELVYKLPGRFRLFKTVIGIDDSVRETGDVRVEIKGDGKGLWQGDVRGSEPARELEVDIAGVKRLEIIVDYGAGLDVGDRLNLCEARVTK